MNHQNNTSPPTHNGYYPSYYDRTPNNPDSAALIPKTSIRRAAESRLRRTTATAIAAGGILLAGSGALETAETAPAETTPPTSSAPAERYTTMSPLVQLSGGEVNAVLSSDPDQLRKTYPELAVRLTAIGETVLSAAADGYDAGDPILHIVGDTAITKDPKAELLQKIAADTVALGNESGEYPDVTTSYVADAYTDGPPLEDDTVLAIEAVKLPTEQ